MKVADLKTPPAQLAAKLDDAKEGIVDALLNLTWRRTSGAGTDGEVVLGVKPSLRFVSGFLLPRFEETGQRDETSDIHISTHGLDLQIAKNGHGQLAVSAAFCFYVRTLPTWEELLSPKYDLFPNHPLRRDVEASVRDEMKRRLEAALAQVADKPADEVRRSRRDLQQSIYRELLGQHGVALSASDTVIDAGEPSDEAESAAERDSEDEAEPNVSRLVPQNARYIFTRDDAAQEIDIPQKWKRLSVVLPTLAADLSDEAAVLNAATAWTQQARAAILKAAADWIQSEEGKNWAYRPSNIRPSHVRSESAWNNFLSGLRSTPPRSKYLVPDLSGVSLTIQFDDDLRDADRRNLRIMIENNGSDVRKRQVIDAFRDEVAKVHRRHGRDGGQVLTRLISGGIDVAEIQDIMRQADGEVACGDDFPDLAQSLRNIVATSAISHGVDVDKFNAMFFAGMPNDIAEFIQASSRIGRTHPGFSLLVPTPQSRRDRYILEIHDVFHRFLERMIAPPAITRWAASAHDRILTSLFQAWLSGWAEQKLFIDQQDKTRALRFETVNDVNRFLNGTDLPDAARDFMDFCVRAVGIGGRGDAALGAAPHRNFYDERIRNLAKQLTDEFRADNATTPLGEYWENSRVGQKPMMSLRDIDEAGKFLPAKPFGSRRTRGTDDKTLIAEALRIVRRQRGAVGELDSDDGQE